jgi:transcriptional regulator
MYLPKHFEETDRSVLHGLMRAHPLAAWVTTDGDGAFVANHVPFLVDPDRGENGTLIAHVARANPVWRTTARSVIIFQGPHAYVSPSWYPTKQESGKVVPTWNYAVVHAHGTPRAIEDRDWLLRLVSRLTDTHEAGRPARWQVTDAPADYIDQMLRAIVGIEMPIERLEGKWKVSQNRSAADRAGVVKGLEALGDGTMAALVTAAMNP